jgi:hypothetical protein
MHLYHGIHHNVYHGIYHGIYYGIHYGIYYGIYHAPVVYIIHLKRPTAKAHRMLSAFSISTLRTALFCRAYWTSKVPRASLSSIDSSCSRSQPSAVKPKRLCCMFHFNPVRWTSISLSYGSSTSGNLYRGESGPAA